MGNLLKAFFFKLRRDLTFRITLFIGLGLAVFMTGIYLLIDIGLNEALKTGFIFCTGQSMLITTLNPCQNFGLAVPINLITFIVLEFTSGTIRNKIITGNSKSKIYFSLFLSGIIFTFILITAYVGLCVGVASMIGHFDVNGNVFATLGTGHVTPEFIWKIIVLGVLAYIVITAATVFFATLFRNIGPCIPIVLILLMACYLSATIINVVGMTGLDNDVLTFICTFIRYINPLYSLTAYDTNINGEITELSISNENFIIETTNNVIYTIAFLLGGWGIFIRRDVK